MNIKEELPNNTNSTSCNESNCEVLDKIILDKNVDRVRFINFNGSNSNSVDNEKDCEYLYTLSACYELDKQTKLKSGGLYIHKFKPNTENDTNTNTNNCSKLLECSQKIEFDYGILDYKYEYKDNLLFTSNSDASFSIFKSNTNTTCNNNNSNSNTDPLLSFIDKFSLPTDDPTCTCNTLDISNTPIDSSILLAMNDGFHHIFDLNSTGKTPTKTPIQSIKSHEYGLWACLTLDVNCYLTGSEDSLLKMWDRRQQYSNNNNGIAKASQVNKSHTASVNCIYKDSLLKQGKQSNSYSCLDNPNLIITGSYDEHFTVIDIRNFDKVVHRQKLNCSIWDINQREYKDKKLLFMSCVYEGFNIFEYSDSEAENNSNSNNFNHKVNNFLSFGVGQSQSQSQSFSNKINNTTLHNSIVYGVDSLIYNGSLYLSTCSFYDNTVILWKLKI